VALLLYCFQSHPLSVGWPEKGRAQRGWHGQSPCLLLTLDGVPLVDVISFRIVLAELSVALAMIPRSTRKGGQPSQCLMAACERHSRLTCFVLSRFSTPSFSGGTTRSMIC
jgi:hypothetical protein